MNRDRAAMTVGVRKRLSMETLEKKTYTGSPVQIYVSLVSMVLGPPMPGEGCCGLLAGQDRNKASSLEAWDEDRMQ